MYMYMYVLSVDGCQLSWWADSRTAQCGRGSDSPSSARATRPWSKGSCRARAPTVTQWRSASLQDGGCRRPLSTHSAKVSVKEKQNKKTKRIATKTDIKMQKNLGKPVGRVQDSWWRGDWVLRPWSKHQQSFQTRSPVIHAQVNNGYGSYQNALF